MDVKSRKGVLICPTCVPCEFGSQFWGQRLWCASRDSWYVNFDVFSFFFDHLLCTATEGGKQLFQCIDSSSMSMSSIVMRYLLFLYLGTIVYELALLVLPILQKQPVSNTIIIQHLLWIVLAVTALKYQPVGFIVMVPVIHCLSRVLFYMLTVMQTASHELKPNEKWSSRLLWSTLGLMTLLLVHQSYFYVTSMSVCEPNWVRPIVNGVVTLQVLTSIINLATSSTFIAVYPSDVSKSRPSKLHST